MSADRDAALLLAAEAVERSDAVEPLGTLLDVLGTAPLPTRQARPTDEAPFALAPGFDGASVVVGTVDGMVEELRADRPTGHRISKPSTRRIVAVAVDGF